MHKRLVKRFSVMNILVLFLVALTPFLLLVEKAQATAFTNVYIRFDRMTSGTTATTGMICAKPSSNITTHRKLEVTFPDEYTTTDFTVSTTAGDWQSTNLSTSNIDGNTAWPDITNTTASISGKIVTWTHTADQTLNSTNTYCFRWTSTAAVSTPSGTGSNLTGTVRSLNSSDSELSSSKYSTAIITNDQIVISAVVPPTFSVTFGDGSDPDSDANTDSFNGNLSTSIVSTYGNTITITTNAVQGWIAWAKSANAALNSVSTGGTIATPGSVDGTPSDLDLFTGYVLDVDATTQGSGGSGNFTIEPEYDGDTTQGGTLSTTFQPVAISDNPAGPTDGDVITLIERAKISAVQAAATDYTDTLTVVAAGRF